MKSNATENAASFKHIAAFFCSLCLSLLILMHFADWWALNQNPSWPEYKLLILRISGSAMLSFFACALMFWMRASSLRIRLYFACWFALCMLLFVASWPGYFMSDTVSALKYSLEYPMELWLGFFKPFLFFSILQIFPHVSAITFLQLTIVAAVFAYATEVITVVTGRRLYVFVFFVLVAINPSILFNMALLSRDTLFSVIVLWGVAFIVRLSYEKATTSPLLLVAGALVGLLVPLRGDGWLVLLPFLISFAAISKKLKDCVVVSSAALVMAILFSWILPKAFGYQGNEFQYMVANTVNPVGYVLQSRFHTDAGNNKTLMGKVLDLKKLADIQTPYEIPYWWNGGGANIEKAKPEDRVGYLGHVYGFLKENSGIFLAGRVETFLASTGFNGAGFKIMDMYRDGWPVEWVPPKSVGVDLGSRPFPTLTDSLQTYFAYSATYDPSLRSGSVVFWNFLPSLAVILIALLTRPSGFGLSLAAMIVLTRVPVVFLAAPASQFKYYLSVQLCGPFFLLLLIAATSSTFFSKERLRHL